MPDSSRAAIGGMTLFIPDGRSVMLDQYAGATLVVQFVRYFGCLPCQVHLRDLDDRSGELAAVRARAITVGGSADYQARWLREAGIAIPLLLDPDERLRDRVGFGDLSGRQLLSPRSIRNYLSAIVAGVGPQRPTADAKRSPGIAIFDAGLDLRWTHEGKALGDYLPLEAVLAAVRSIATS